MLPRLGLLYASGGAHRRAKVWVHPIGSWCAHPYELDFSVIRGRVILAPLEARAKHLVLGLVIGCSRVVLFLANHRGGVPDGSGAWQPCWLRSIGLSSWILCGCESSVRMVSLQVLAWNVVRQLDY